MDSGPTKQIGPNLIVVIGMHRSGTSAITRGLVALGVGLGNNLLPAVAGDNDRGYWEDRDIHDLCESLLASLDHHWATLSLLTPQQLSVALNSPFFDRACKLIRLRLDSHPVFGLKNPRICKLLPFWAAVFDEVGARAAFIIAVRNPLSVARSLNRNGLRGEIPAFKAYMLWLVHVVESIWGTTDRRRIIVDFDNLLLRPSHELARVAASLDLPLPNDSAVADYANDFLSPELRHSHVTVDVLDLQAELPLDVLQAYRMCQHASNDSSTTLVPDNFSQTFLELRVKLESQGELFAYLDRQDQKLEMARTQLVEQRKKFAEVVSRDARISKEPEPRDASGTTPNHADQAEAISAIRKQQFAVESLGAQLFSVQTLVTEASLAFDRGGEQFSAHQASLFSRLADLDRAIVSQSTEQEALAGRIAGLDDRLAEGFSAVMLMQTRLQQSQELATRKIGEVFDTCADTAHTSSQHAEQRMIEAESAADVRAEQIGRLLTAGMMAGQREVVEAISRLESRQTAALESLQRLHQLQMDSLSKHYEKQITSLENSLISDRSELQRIRNWHGYGILRLLN